MKKLITDICDIVIAFGCVIADITRKKLSEKTIQQKIMLSLIIATGLMCIIRMINWHNIGGEILLLIAEIIIYKEMKR